MILYSLVLTLSLTPPLGDPPSVPVIASQVLAQNLTELACARAASGPLPGRAAAKYAGVLDFTATCLREDIE